MAAVEFSRMRHRITFLKPDAAAINSMNETVPEYTAYKTVWANVSPRTGREYDEAQKIRAETTYNITTRHIDGITTDMQIAFGDQIFRIESVLNVGERNTRLLIVAVEVDHNGKGGS